ncbi:MAG: CDP-diacylglycerol--glycerol-3-phosphate 3-phosphatidyltransferase [Candidatus Kapabacteria bacterium]|nr:CDP-diacylglycerol--glycerol-3-phosphate 3-phosphatidyltransferase [Ignavibacteriota bacterium]MCW5884475.1 CDP-diacylglycerol--glycerol-3-phosphate 3-phosphatidyltransferase [Candidatus Kapabacteria bacterium]
MKQLPNILSLLRIVISPIFFLMLISENPTLICLSLPLFIIGAISDYLDGWFARRMKAISRFGKFFDPLADKFLTGAAFLAFAVLSIVPLWMVLIIIFRDILTTAMRFMPQSGNQSITTSKPAKIKTFIQMIFIFVILLTITFINCPMNGFNPENLVAFLYSDFVYYSMMVIVVLTLWTLIDYSKQNKRPF